MEAVRIKDATSEQMEDLGFDRFEISGETSDNLKFFWVGWIKAKPKPLKVAVTSGHVLINGAVEVKNIHTLDQVQDIMKILKKEYETKAD